MKKLLIIILLLFTINAFGQVYSRGDRYFYNNLSSDSRVTWAGSYDNYKYYNGTQKVKNTEYFQFYQRCRIRQDGNIVKLKFYINGGNVDSLFVKFWRYASDSNFTLIGKTENLKPQLQDTVSRANDYSICYLATPIPVKAGDYYSILVYNQDSVNILFTYTYGITYYTVVGTEPNETYKWQSKSNFVKFIPMSIYIDTPPVFAVIGNSIMAGNYVQRSYLDGSGSVSDTVIPDKLSELFGGYTFQNMGRGGEQSTELYWRFQKDIINLNPKFIIIEGGINDIYAGITSDSIINNYERMLNMSYKRNIRTIVLAILPYSNGTIAQCRQIDSINIRLQTLVSVYPSFIFINANSEIGEFREGGDIGNYWNIKAIYDYDGAHFSEVGYKKIAEIIYNNIK